MATGAQLGTQLEHAPVPSEAVEAGGLKGRALGLWGKAQVGWAGMQPKQRVWAGVAAGLIVALMAGLAWSALHTEWRTLYSDLDAEDSRQVGSVLTQAQIPFRTAGTGNGIEVRSTDLDKARLATAAKGSLRSGRMGFELFDKPNWVGSEFDEQVNYQRALEGELEKTIGTLGDVDSARVHLVMPHDSLFRDQDRPAKASVTLKLKHRSLADGEPEAIRNLVASAVDGLSPERVSLVDAAGHMPLGPKTPESEKLTAEEALEEKLIATLEPVTGPGNVRASVTLDYQAAALEETRESYDPSQTVTLSLQRTEQTAGQQPVAAGVPGTASNAPNSQQSPPVYPPVTTPPSSSKSEASTFGASKTTRHSLENPGRIRRMTAAIVVNDRLMQPASWNKPAQRQARTADELKNLTALAQAAVGFDPGRGDTVTVEDLAFEANRAQASGPAAILGQAEQSPTLIKYLALVAGLLIVVAFGVRPAIKRARLQPALKELPAKAALDAEGKPIEGAVQLDAEGHELPAGAAGELPPKPMHPVLEPLPPDPERQRLQEIFDQVTRTLKRDPAQSSRLLQSWIHSDN